MQGELQSQSLPVMTEIDTSRQENGQLELHIDAVSRRQFIGECGQATRLAPHTMGDGAIEAEEAGAECVQMNRVVVTRDAGIAPPQAFIE